MAEDGKHETPKATSAGEDANAVPSQDMQPAPGDELHSQDTCRRRMPPRLRRYLLQVQGGKLYLPAAYRIVWFRDECPDWGVTTQIVEGGQKEGFATVLATIRNAEGRIIATGHKTETQQDFPAGWVEKAETGAIARALALAGFGTQFSPELDEEGRLADSPLPPGPDARLPVERRVRQPALARRETTYEAAVKEPKPGAPAGEEIWQGPGQCPRCHAPAGKPHGKPCVD
ncbi:MAG: hypothetical protein ACP5VE_03580 [Chthonomonadales bacterium]